MRRALVFLPLAIFIAFAGFLGLSLRGDPAELPSMLIDQPLPDFELPPLEGRTGGLSDEDMLGQVTLLNVFGSWCVPCQQEHPVLMQIAETGLVNMAGINWRDRPEAVERWFARSGDPFNMIGVDQEGRLLLELGVAAAPESFLVDRQGRIRHKHVGQITEEILRDELLPLVQALRAE
jgi:cytochrome c biogenesis protein CcmG/thiol:disulfide interchange protein DsbE